MDILKKMAQSRPMKELYRNIQRVAPTNASILLEGERGTEKELVAKSIHYNSLQKAKVFITVNCSTFIEPLPLTYLFGHEQWAPSGSVTSQIGLFELANNGTLFLDEISELPKLLQSRLLRIIHEKNVVRGGGTTSIPVDFRLITASYKNLEDEVEKGNFNEDLFYKLNVVKMTIPPLRERQEDIPFLINFFIEKHTQKSKVVRQVTGIDKEAANTLYYYNWKGNANELENIIEKCVILSDGPLITPENIPSYVRRRSDTTLTLGAIPEGLSLPETLAVVEKRMIQQAMKKSGNIQIEAAKILCIGKSGLNQKLKKYDIDKS